MQALAKPEVGDFLSKHFVSVYDKVGTFQVNVGGDGKTPNKNGGNVAAFFCSPTGRVIHVATGPRTAEAFLSEAKWATEVAAQLKSDRSFGFGQVNSEQVGQIATVLREKHTRTSALFSTPDASAKDAWLAKQDTSSDPKQKGLDAAGRRQREQVHRLLQKHAFESLAVVGPEVYTHILGEMVTNEPVKLTGAPEARQAGRTGQSLTEFFDEGGSAQITPPKPSDSPSSPDKSGKSAKQSASSRNSGKR